MKSHKSNNLTYISLFSGAGIGCYGFKLENFNCVATVEKISRRLDIQKINKKCIFNSGYINGDLSLLDTKNKIYSEIEKWKKERYLNNVDVLIATPPCQGMSTVNSKKNANDLFRNSLVVDSVELVENIKPNFFIFENVPAFMKTTCISNDIKYQIGEYIYQKLSKNYSIYHNVINFKDYGVPSSRKRCLVIGVKNNLSDYISPLELFPDFILNKQTIRETIYELPRLKKMGEIDNNDIFHFFRSYDIKMRPWISAINSGMSAYENKNPNNIPHKVIDGNIVFNKNNMGGKYRRQEWDQVASCIHTRNDQLASQNTIHPEDDRVFSIRELMKFMTIPDSFKWIDDEFDNLNLLNLEKKIEILRKNELNIRQVIGESVPTNIFKTLASKINYFTSENIIKSKKNIFNFQEINPNKEANAAFYSNKFIVNEIVKNLPNFDNVDTLRILEPSVGLGSFLTLLFKKYEKHKKVEIDVIDIDVLTINKIKKIFSKKYLPNNIKINFFTDDFLFKKFHKQKYDLVIGNPPFKILNNKEYILELKNQFGKQSNKNILTFFILKAMEISKVFSFILPKNFLLAPQYNSIRDIMSEYKILHIFDFENLGFKNVILETIGIIVDNKKTNNEIIISNLKNGKKIIQLKSYIFDKQFPNWIIYRNDYFDEIISKIKTDIFSVFRDRQLTNRYLSHNKEGVRVLRSRNIGLDGNLNDIIGYDKYLKNISDIANLSILKFMNDSNSYICPNFTTNIRVIKKPINTLTNGSVAVFKNKTHYKISENDINWFSTNEFIEFYKISNNFQKNTINLDKNSIFYFGVKYENRFRS